MSAAPILRVCEFDFMRCGKCGRLVTQRQMNAALAKDGTGRACPCGSLKYAPANLPWYGWLLPRVLTFAWARVQQIGWREAISRTAHPRGPSA